MLTKLYLTNMDFDSDTICTTLEDVDAPVVSGNTLNVNIQSLTPYLSMGKPNKIYARSKGNSMLINSSTCIPGPKWSITSVNYLEVTCERNSDFSDLYAERKVGEVTYYYLPKGTLLQCKFSNGRMTHPTVNTDTYIEECS